MPHHQDPLIQLNKKGPIQTKIDVLYRNVRLHNPSITRLAVALYDPATDLVKTYVYAAERTTPLPHYQSRLRETPSLLRIVSNDTPRLLNDLSLLETSPRSHTRALLDAGYLASYTVPMIFNEQLLGFVFFNAERKNAFDEKQLSELDMVAHMITLLIYNEQSNVQTLAATVKSALDMTHSRDPETGSHLERMSRYARLIARELAGEFGLTDEAIEHIYLFAPLHDLGKLKVPDNILLKAGRLSEPEYEVMKAHPSDGLEMIDKLIENYGLSSIGHIDILRNIALCHHEALDGSGYPRGLRGDEIPVEARIVTVADVFDALTSARPYKAPWPVDKAFEHLLQLAGSKLDPRCVDALVKNRDEVTQIMEQFKENEYG